MVASSGVDSHGGSDNQQQDANGQGDCCRASYPLVVIVGWRQQAGGGSGSQGVIESGPNASSHRRVSASTLSPYPQQIWVKNRKGKSGVRKGVSQGRRGCNSCKVYSSHVCSKCTWFCNHMIRGRRECWKEHL